MTTNKEDLKIFFSLLNLIYIMIFVIIHWNKSIGDVFVWEFFMLWIYVVLIPTLIIFGILIILGILINK